MDAEWWRWLGGIVAAGFLGAAGWFVKTLWNIANSAHVHANEGDRRLHERIDTLVSNIEAKVQAIRDEARRDRHEIGDKIDDRLAEADLQRQEFREMVFREMQALSTAIGEIRGLLAVPPRPGRDTRRS